MSFVVTAVVGSIAVTAYGASQQRKAGREQRDAIAAAQDADARKAAEAETQAMVAANAKTADAKRRRRGSALSLGGEAEALGGTPATALGAVPAMRSGGGGMTGLAATALGSAMRSTGGGAAGVASGNGAYRPSSKVQMQ